MVLKMDRYSESEMTKIARAEFKRGKDRALKDYDKYFKRVNWEAGRASAIDECLEIVKEFQCSDELCAEIECLMLDKIITKLEKIKPKRSKE